jgi:hypothetical protein
LRTNAAMCRMACSGSGVIDTRCQTCGISRHTSTRTRVALVRARRHVQSVVEQALGAVDLNEHRRHIREIAVDWSHQRIVGRVVEDVDRVEVDASVHRQDGIAQAVTDARPVGVGKVRQLRDGQRRASGLQHQQQRQHHAAARRIASDDDASRAHVLREQVPIHSDAVSRPSGKGMLRRQAVKHERGGASIQDHGFGLQIVDAGAHNSHAARQPGCEGGELRQAIAPGTEIACPHHLPLAPQMQRQTHRLGPPAFAYARAAAG